MFLLFKRHFPKVLIIFGQFWQHNFQKILVRGLYKKKCKYFRTSLPLNFDVDKNCYFP